MKIPKTIKGFGFEYPVIQKNGLRDKGGRWSGLIKHQKGEIKIDKSQHQRRKEEALLHEIIHFVSYEKRLNLSEKKIDSLSSGLYQVLKDSKLLK